MCLSVESEALVAPLQIQVTSMVGVPKMSELGRSGLALERPAGLTSLSLAFVLCPVLTTGYGRGNPEAKKEGSKGKWHCPLNSKRSERFRATLTTRSAMGMPV